VPGKDPRPIFYITFPPIVDGCQHLPSNYLLINHTVFIVFIYFLPRENKTLCLFDFLIIRVDKLAPLPLTPYIGKEEVFIREVYPSLPPSSSEQESRLRSDAIVGSPQLHLIHNSNPTRYKLSTFNNDFELQILKLQLLLLNQFSTIIYPGVHQLKNQL
jgi:hypothetical protein